MRHCEALADVFILLSKLFVCLFMAVSVGTDYYNPLLNWFKAKFQTFVNAILFQVYSYS